MTGCSQGNGASCLPENIFCLGSSGQSEFDRRTHSKCSGNLEYKNIVWPAQNSNICWDDNRSRPFIQAGCKSFSSNISSAQIHEIGIRTSGSIGVGSLHITYGSG